MKIFTGILDLLIGLALLAGAITEFGIYGAFREKIPAYDSRGFRITAGIVGGLMVLLGILMLAMP